MIVHDDALSRETIERVLQVKIYEPFCGIVIRHDSWIVGACIFNNYDTRDVHFTCAFDGSMTMRDARDIARFVFKQLGCHRCTAVTRSGNDRARKALEQLGFRVEGCLRQHFVDDDGIIYGLLRSEQRIARL